MTRRALKILALVLAIGIFLFLENFVRTDLWKHVSYTNDEALDLQLQNLSKAADWNYLAMGSSEVRWGFNPEVFEDELAKFGITKLKGFNLGMDNFSLGYIEMILPYVGFGEKPLKNIRYVLIGINLAEIHSTTGLNADSGFDCEKDAGQGQRTVFKSAWMFDNGGDNLCFKSTPQRRILRWISKYSALFRYRSQLRSYLLKTNLKINDDLLQTSRGAYRRRGMTQVDHDFDFSRYIRTEGDSFHPIDETDWHKQLEPGGSYFEIKEFFKKRGIYPIFYSLGTNPESLVLQKRIENYKNNSKTMRKWAEEQNVGFLDMGIKFEYDSLSDFTDHRHMSAVAADRFSREIAKALAKQRSILQH